MPGWTFLTNHAMILGCISRHPRMTGLELANSVGITERAVRKAIVDLLEEGYITKTKEGRHNRYRVAPDQPLRLSAHQQTDVGELLKVLGWKDRRRTQRSP